MTALDKLIEAVEAGVLTEDQALGNGGCLPMCHSTWLAFGGSLDAALALHEAMLTGWHVDRLMQCADGSWDILIAETGGGWFPALSTTPARAWLLAILRAYRSVQA